MAGFMEVGFPFSSLNQSQGVPTFADMQQRLHTSSNNSHWSFLTATTGGQHPHCQPAQPQQVPHLCRKRSFEQSLHANEQVKKVRTEMPLAYSGVQQMMPGQVQGASTLCSMDMQPAYHHYQQMTYPNSYVMEHQTVVMAEQKYHSSLLESLLHEAHGC